MDVAKQGSPTRRGNILQAGLGVLLGVILLVLVMRNVHIGEVTALLGHATMAPLILAFVAYVADFILRAARFWIMLL